MKIAFISDIHGNAVALEAVLQDIQSKKVDQIAVLGDLCFRGPEPKRTLDLIRSLHANVIKGNGDEWVVRGFGKGEVPDEMVDMLNQERDWTMSKLDQEDITYLNELPRQLTLKINGKLTIHAFHATPTSLFDVVYPDEKDDVIRQKLMSTADAEMYVYGHIHHPFIRFVNGKWVVNIGSVGLPFDGLAKASYVIVECHENGIHTSIERVAFDLDKVISQYESFHYPNANALSNAVRYAAFPK